MMLEFTKMHGAGNDYIYIDCFNGEPEDPGALSVRLSDRHFGIGGDGVILVCASHVADAKMRMFNADGSEGRMCGNGIRCVGKFVYEKKNIRKPVLTIETLAGIKTLEIHEVEGQVESITVDMQAPGLSPQSIPTTLTGETVIDRPVDIDGTTYNITCVSMGSPHAVVFCKEDVRNLDLEKIGPKFEKNPIFPDGVNTEFINVIDKNTLRMRVWERGSGETLACGTGACASVVAANLNGFCEKNQQIKVMLTGGDLHINYTGDTVFMTGGCEIVFEGSVKL
ncbi:MAG: diaminopimelate epimerase [Ruminococcaceae bacterium]|nr:diaminopimelate epimerase [Oscillospiraceae bacterium]